MPNLLFKLNDHLYLRDPQHTALGQSIVRSSIDLIDRLGFEHFTFKKLAEEIDSTEASIYRYFENKHRLLLYLIAWYWSWMEYRIDMFTSGIADPKEKLKACMKVLAEEKKYDPNVEFIDEEALYRIVVAELDKTFLTNWVDEDNKEGLFGGFKSLCKKIAGWVTETNPDYPYANSLVSTILLAAKQQNFFSEHLPSLTSIKKNPNSYLEMEHFLESILFNVIANKR
jgi:hypothetical protein